MSRAPGAAVPGCYIRLGHRPIYRGLPHGTAGLPAAGERGPLYLLPAMQVKVNGQPADLEPGMNLESLIKFYRLKLDQVVVELNRKVPPKSAYATTQIQAGDEVEIVKFLGGG